MHKLLSLLVTPLLAVPVPAVATHRHTAAGTADAVLSGGFVSPGTGAITWSVAPAGPAGADGRASLDYKLDPGATVTDRVVVTNHSAQALTLRIYASDALTTPDGGFDLLAADRTPVDAGAWITPERDTVALPASSRVVVPLVVAVPGNATPGDHVGGVVASVTARATGPDGSAVAVDHRVGTRVHLRVTGELRPELAVRDLGIDSHQSWAPWRLPALTSTFTVANTGNVRLMGAPSIRTRGKAFDGPDLPQILPGGQLRATVAADGVWPLFRTSVEIAVTPVDLDGRALAPRVTRTTVWLVPWPQLAVLGAVLLLVAAAILARRWRRKRMAVALAAAERRGRELALTSHDKETTT
ncbi:WxL protein peptidoglycan domain-containing protein [Catenuloplanes japonicus]|uniref:WxL protein peptidoglycan domain-containing protein n=1 Tax=Catenuloplanes japonicus TaxID=33876 RepID=UPI0006923F4F|nr:DUF916 domain-containing protein [Catenuloplanes japonicus]